MRKAKLIIMLVMAGLLLTAGATEAKANESKKSLMKISAKNWQSANRPTDIEMEDSVIVLDFWASWCMPCIKAIGHMNQIEKKYGKKGVIVLGLSQDKKIEQTKATMKRHGIKYHIAMDKGAISNKFAVRYLPTILVIGHDGKILWRGSPYDPQFDRAIENAIKRMPPKILDGVSMGGFTRLKKQLSGSKDFAKAYHLLKKEALKEGPKAIKAKEILGIINAKLVEKIAAIKKNAADDKKKLFKEYQKLVKRFAGADAMAIVEQEYK